LAKSDQCHHHVAVVAAEQSHAVTRVKGVAVHKIRGKAFGLGAKL
jgi:hypothetical protein